MTSDQVDTGLDTTVAQETPEGVLLLLHLAGPFTRAQAYAVDLALRTALFVGIAAAVSVLGMLGSAVALLVLFGLEWLYPVYFEVWHHGQTPGKRLCGIAVLHDDGTPVTLGPSLIRNLLRAVDALPIGYVVGGLATVCARRAQRLGDLAAGTVVIRVGTVNEMDLAPRDATSGRRTSTAALLPDERQAIVEFARRRDRLTPERAEELARLAGPLVGGAPDGQAAAALVALAHDITGVEPPVSSPA